MAYLYHPIQVLGLSERHERTLMLEGIFTVEGLRYACEDGLQNIPAVGAKTVTAVIGALSRWERSQKWRVYDKTIDLFQLMDIVFVHDGFPRLFRDGLITNQVFSSDDFQRFFEEKDRWLSNAYELKHNEILRAKANKTPEFVKFATDVAGLFLGHVKTHKEFYGFFSFLCKMLMYFDDKDAWNTLFYNDVCMRALVKRYIIKVIAEEGSFPVVGNKLPVPYPAILFDELKEEAKKEGKVILFAGDRYVSSDISFVAWVELLPPKEKEVMQRRMMGMSLAGIGKEIHLSRERIRQISNSALAKRNILSEDKFIPLFTKYKWNMNSFCYLTGEPVTTYYYLCMTQKCGEIPLSEIITDDTVSDEMKTRYKEYSPKETMTREKITAFLNFAKSYVKAPVSISKFITDYEKFAREHNLKDTYLDRKTLVARLLRTNIYLFGDKDMFRQYPLMEVDIHRLESEIGLADFKDEVISADYLFEKYPAVMKEFDIHSGNELHSLLKQRENELSVKGVSFGRRPIIFFGTCSVKEQAVRLLKEKGELHRREFAELYCERFGVNIASFSANIAPLLREYRTYGNLYKFSKEFLTQKELRSLKGVLTDELYSAKDAFTILGKKLSKDRISLINADTFWNLGYYKRNKFILKRKYSNILDALDAYFAKSDMRYFDHKILNLPMVNVYFREKMEACALFHIGLDMVVNDKWLAKHGYTKEAIADFAEAIDRFAGDDVFTIFSLKNSGFDHPFLRDVQLQEHLWLLGSFLKGSNRFKYYTLKEGIVFHRTHKNPGAPSLVAAALKENPSASVEDIQAFIVRKFGISLSAIKVKFIRKRLLENKGAGA